MAGVKGQKGTLSTEVANKFEETFLDSMDGRAATTRNLRQRFGALVTDLGGTAGLSYQEKSLCKRLIHLERLIERKESTLAGGGNVEETNYLSAINALSGLCGKLGLKRRCKPVLSLSDYLANGKATTEQKTTTLPNTATDQADPGQEDTQDGHPPPQPKENKS